MNIKDMFFGLFFTVWGLAFVASSAWIFQIIQTHIFGCV